MKKTLFALLALVGIMIFVSCSDTETYADKKKKERAAINKFIADSAVNVISEATFFAQDSTTNVSRNEYVLFNSSGVYMQIVRKGTGSKLNSGETSAVLMRFTEVNLMTDSVLLSNDVLKYSAIVDHMNVRNISGSFYGQFVSGESLFASYYSTTSVPAGLLVPFAYINLARYASAQSNIAKVKLIVPSAKGTTIASSSVYPCLYELTLQKGR